LNYKFYNKIKRRLLYYTYHSHLISKTRHKKFIKYLRKEVNKIEPTSRSKTLEYVNKIYSILNIKINGNKHHKH